MDPPIQLPPVPIMAGHLFYVASMGTTDKGKAFMKLRSVVPDGVREVVVVVINPRAAKFEYSYSISNPGTDTVQLYHGKHGDPTKDTEGPMLGIPE